MASASPRNRSKSINGINMTPFVDIVLVLLVIMIMTMKVVGHTRALPAELPRASNAKSIEAHSVTIAISADGQVTIDGEVLAGPALKTAAARIDRTQRIVVAADGRTSHASVVDVLDVLAEAGLSRVSFAARADKK